MTRRPLPVERLAGALAAPRGLASGEVEERRRRWGENRIVESPRRGWWDVARETLRDPMIAFFALVAVLYAAVGQRTEALTLLAAIVPLVAMDAFLHRRTAVSRESLQGRLATRAIVVRDGAAVEVPAGALVPGDLAVVAAGEPFPADGVIVAGDALQADESALTGEAFPVAKRALSAAAATGPEPLVDHEHWGLAGTRLLTGRATLWLVYTGAETLYGEIVRAGTTGAQSRTPLQAAIAQLVARLVAGATLVCLSVAAARLAQGYGVVDALVSALTLAAAALPEEFPVVFTFFLGVGAYRLARRQALVRRAVSVENVGRVTCICADKTGTITEGQLRLARLLPTEGMGEERLLALAATAGRPEAGDPLDVAIAGAAGARGAPPVTAVVATFPFTETRRRETAIVRGDDGTLVSVTKGGAETILALTELDPAARATWTTRADALANDGHKVIACAWQPLAADVREEPGTGYRLAGLLAFEDPVRDGVTEALVRCRQAGIRTIMVTGDHPLTAAAVARHIGLGSGTTEVITGDDLATRLARDEGLRDVDVVARATPAQKLALVRALQAAGEVVAVTGDGVNDVPALQAADVGIAMGERGTRSAREIAAIVLLDDNIRTIVNAVAEGRQLFRNLQASFQYLLMIHIPLVIAAALVPLAGYPLLYLPVHIVWLEMLIHPTALLVFQAPAPAGLPAVERGRRPGFFKRREWAVIVAVGTVLTALVLAGYAWSAGEAGQPEHGRAMALATMSVASAVFAAALSGLRTWAARVIILASVVVAVGLIQWPDAAAALHLAPLHGGDWLLAILGALLAAVPIAVSRRA
jgi:Ca2+-transporting ATPase